MKVPIKWLKDYVDINASPEEIAHRLTISGSKVEGLEKQGDEIKNVRTARIMGIWQHPNANKLKVTKVFDGKDTVQVVTGAGNIVIGSSEGKIVSVAFVGAELPGNIKISKGKLRGEDSNGMMCSIQELNLSAEDYPDADEDGIWILPDNTEVGIDIKDYLGLNDTIIDFEITPNRPDCLSVIGMARETAATFEVKFTKPVILLKEDGEQASKYATVEVQNYDLCPRYAARIITDVKIEPSPIWMQDRLSAAGVRAINNIVDITNFVMLETGQPMHAFDLANLQGNKIVVRTAYENESMTTLDGKERELDTDTLVIADAVKPVALAGVMGGENSEVTENTRTILFESANFNGTTVRRAAKKVGLRTEASSRFEKGLDLDNVIYALDRAAMLIEELGTGVVCKGIMDCIKTKPVKKEIRFIPENINKFLGTDISAQRMVDILKSLEFEFSADMSKVNVPIFRGDVEREADLIEEVARFYNYNNIKPTLLEGKASTKGGKTYEQKMRDKIVNTALACGYSEIYTYSITGPKIFDKLNISADDELRNAVIISNPIGEDLSIMRTTTLGQMLECLSQNYNKRIEKAKLFEMAYIYKPAEAGSKDSITGLNQSIHSTGPDDIYLPEQRNILTFGAYGGADFYDMKGLCEELFSALKIKKFNFQVESTNATFHPGRTAKIIIGGQQAGIIGEIHPATAENFGCDTRTYCGYLFVDVLIKNATESAQYKPLPKFPSITRDIAMLVEDSVTVADIERLIKKKAGNILEKSKLFDVYKGKQVPEGYKSIAYSVVFRAENRTLTDDEVSKVMKDILTALEEKHGAQLRG